MTLFNQFLEHFGGYEIARLTADREFVGKNWFGYLLNDPLTPFRIRIRENHTLNDGSNRFKVKIVFQDLQVGQHKVLRHRRQLWGIGCKWIKIS
jgi:hypothetical protein